MGEAKVFTVRELKAALDAGEIMNGDIIEVVEVAKEAGSGGAATESPGPGASTN